MIRPDFGKRVGRFVVGLVCVELLRENVSGV